MRFHRSPDQRGFTLVEIMMVVAIIGVLSSVALPQMGKATLRARAAERRAIMSAIAVVSSDYMLNNTLPAAGLTGPPNPAADPSTMKHRFDPMLGDWHLLQLAIEGYTYYQYTFSIANATPPILTVSAEGDLDGDGVRSTKEVVYVGVGNAFMWQVEHPAEGSEDLDTF
jgi:prepilin-type N-terminal cleavage/methylation domain-containing protein